MGYRRMKKKQLYEIYRRWQRGQKLAWIAENERWDRKTVRQYLQAMQQAGLERGAEPVSREQFYAKVKSLLPQRQEKDSPAREQLSKHEEELRQLITDNQEPLKPKTAFLVIREKYGISASYETFKRFVRERGLAVTQKPEMIRIELGPGIETQLDYGRVGRHYDEQGGRNRVVWGFCGILVHSRLPYLEFVYTQQQQEFADSVVKMLHFYRGVTEFLSIDNLKAGVIKPDLWDPQINRTLAEVAEYYGTFINPCRVGRSTDKAKVERFIPVARELFRMLKHLHPSAGLAELNRLALQWCTEDYGRREHGTTGVPPMEAFQREQGELKKLPEQRFEVPVWQEVPVHGGDQFFSFQKKRFSMPRAYRGKKVWVRYVKPLLRVYWQEQVVREYVMNGQQKLYWVAEDFPEAVREMMNGGYPAYLLGKAQVYGQAAAALIGSVLRPHAYLNARRAQGMLELMEKHHREWYFEEVCGRARARLVKIPSTFRRMLEAQAQKTVVQGQLPLSEVGRQMVRDIRYYVN